MVEEAVGVVVAVDIASGVVGAVSESGDAGVAVVAAGKICNVVEKVIKAGGNVANVCDGVGVAAVAGGVVEVEGEAD